MPNPGLEKLSPRGAEIMAILWEIGNATAEQIREALPDTLHDSTVRTLLRQLEEKGYVDHELRGKTFIYHATVERDQVQTSALHSFIKRFFGGSAEALVQRLLSEKRLTAGQLDKIRKTVSGSSSKPGKRKPSGGAR